MSYDVKYIGMDVHKEAIVIAVLNEGGKLVMESVIKTKASSNLQFLHGLRGELHVTWEEGTWAAWLYDLLQPQVQHIVVCNPRRNAFLKEGSKSDKVDARSWPTCYAPGCCDRFTRGKRTTDATRVGAQLSDHQQRFNASDESIEGAVSRLGHSLCRHPGLCCALSRGMVEQDSQAGVRRRADLLYQQLDGLQILRRNVRPEFWRRAGNIRPRNCCVRFPASVRFSRPLDRANANPASVSQQAATMDLQWAGH